MQPSLLVLDAKICFAHLILSTLCREILLPSIYMPGSPPRVTSYCLFDCRVHDCKISGVLQVARIREVEVPEARAAEAAAWRAALQRERAQLEEMYSSRVARLRERDAAVSQREAAARQEVEAAAAVHRAALAEEAARLRVQLAVRHLSCGACMAWPASAHVAHVKPR